METINGVDRSTSYTYNDDNRVTSKQTGNTKVAYTYDGFGRISQQVTTSGSTTVLTETFTYNGNSSQIATYATTAGGVTKTYTYTYDDNGNITSITSRTNDITYLTSYEYDTANQLVRENNQEKGYTHIWTYDNAGNIKVRTEYAYTVGILGTPTDTVSYTYDDENWGDLLTDYDGQEFNYDSIGNITDDGIWSYDWQHGRQLASMAKKDGTAEWEFAYNADGLRTQRTDGTTTYTYVYNGSQLTAMTVGSNTLYFSYDAAGAPVSVKYGNDEYYYTTNIQGDVIGIVDSNGTTIVTYTYDAWGNILSCAGSEANTLGAINPLRYRGYVYDQETGLYYVSSRYYDPEIGRFINADGYISTGNGVLEKNMFAYCLNNPVNMVDPSGEIAITTLILIGSIVAGVAVSGYTAYTSHKYTGKVDWNNTILSGLSTFAFCYSYGLSAYGMYVSYCDYKGYTPVTNIGSAPKTNPAPYSNLQDPSNVAPGKDFTASQKAQIIQQNKINNNGVVKSDLSGKTLVPPQKSMKGVTPPANEWQIDHIIPKSAGGTNSFSNAQVLSREENRIKWDH